MTLFESIKSIIAITIFLCLAPFLIESITKQYTPLFEPRTNIAIVSITQQLCSTSCIDQLHSFFKDPLIKGILIKIDCSNAPAGTSQALFHDLRQLKKQYPKPIIALVENICVSGAYLIASACDYIIAPESAIIGNIGTSFCASSLEHIKSDKNDTFQGIETESYHQLIKQVALGRKLSLTTTANWAEGKIFTGTQALALGLINEIGSLCTVIKVLKEKALIENEIEWI